MERIKDHDAQKKKQTNRASRKQKVERHVNLLNNK